MNDGLLACTSSSFFHGQHTQIGHISFKIVTHLTKLLQNDKDDCADSGSGIPTILSHCFYFFVRGIVVCGTRWSVTIGCVCAVRTRGMKIWRTVKNSYTISEKRHEIRPQNRNIQLGQDFYP